MAEPPLIENGAGDPSAPETAEPPADAPAGQPPSPITSPKDNPAADLRNMRRIIAEDPEWSLATVPMLTELCVKHVVDNFESKIFFSLSLSLSLCRCVCGGGGGGGIMRTKSN